MARRRPRPGRGRPLFASLATYCFLVAPFIWSSQQQEHQKLRHQLESSNNVVADADDRLHRAAAFAQKHQSPAVDIEVENRQQYKHVKDTHVDSNNPSALQTFAPARRQNSGGLAVRAPSSPAQAPGKQEPAGISSLLHARSLQDWEVEDLILLATVDGSIYARDRRTGAHRWGPIMAESPVVETIYHRENLSSGLQYQYDDSLNDFLWIVEPVQDGDIYLYNKAQHGILQKLHMTVKGLQERTPHASEEPAVVYVADKTTTLINFDAATGEWLHAYGSGRPRRNDKTTCRLEGLGGFQEQECGLMGSLKLGRVTYTIHIEHRHTAEPICTLKYSEWVPNTRDGDLHMQHNSSMDQSYVYSGHDGRILSLRHGGREDRQPLWKQKLPSPVVRVFDVARPANSDSRDTELVVLPQPVGPMNVETLSGHSIDTNRVFVNLTSAGGWYALSEQMYPTVTSNVHQAQCYDSMWLGNPSSSEKLSAAELEKALIGVHPLAGVPDADTDQRTFRSIGGAISEDGGRYPQATEDDDSLQTLRDPDGYYVSKAIVNLLSAISLLFVAILTYCVFFLDKTVAIEALRKRFAPNVQIPTHQSVQSQPSSPFDAEFSKQTERTSVKEPPPAEQQAVTDIENEETDKVSAEVLKAEETSEDITQIDSLPPSGPSGVLENLSEPIPLEKIHESSRDLQVHIVKSSAEEKPKEYDQLPKESQLESEKKKARRGTRGGKAHRRKNKTNKEDSIPEDEVVADAAPGRATETAVEKALEIEKEPPHVEQDAVTVIPGGSDPTRVDDKTLRIGQLLVLEDKVLGFGSHGTRVFKGSFGGRDVAVKCMLKQLYDIASHEVNVLQESDDHPNVIRYYMMESAGDFMYIALELCPASLAEIVDRPMEYMQLFGHGGLDIVDALRQITLGIRHLHSLKIVHRDIKPENILIATPKKLPSRPDFVPPARLLISDFGLCKKLEVDQSSFRATTAHAAGTSGWRAPELLVDDENEEPPRNESGTGTQYSTNSEPIVVDTSTNRRVTRAIDIFALGCVFYWVLSKGSHPFDGKGRGEGKYMREANIIRGNHNLDDLSVLGAYQGEADELIGRMLAKNPKERPDATQVLSHPFFWSAADRLDFLCHVSDQFEFEPRDPPSYELQTLEDVAPEVIQDCRGDFLKKLPTDFVATLGKQRKYKGDHMLDLLRALRNKKNHYEDMPDSVKAKVGGLPEGYLLFWTERFPKLLMKCHQVVKDCGWESKDRFRKYYEAV